MLSRSFSASIVSLSIIVSVLIVPFVSSAQPGAVIVPPPSDYGQDTNADGVYEYLVVEVTINVTVPGGYMVGVWVNDTEGIPIHCAGVGSYCPVGIQVVSIQLEGIKFWHHGTNGPYSVWVELDSEYPLTPIDDFHGFTQAYTYDQFEALPAVLEAVTERVVDVDGNGRNEFIIADLFVNVSEAKEYRIIFQVMVLDRVTFSWIYLVEIDNVQFLPIGDNLVSITARGSGIEAGGLDGPYWFLMLIFDGAPSFVRWLDDLWYLTPSYGYADFESGSLESAYSSTIPEIDGVSSEGEWDDATVANMSRPDMENPFGAFMLVKNSPTVLYICMDAVDDLTDDAGDYATVAFDTGNDHNWTNNQEDQFKVGRGEGNTMHSLYDEAGASWFTNTHCAPFDETEPDHSGLEGAAGFGTSARESANHSIYELAIPLALIDAEPCDVVGLATAGHRFDTKGVYDANRDSWSSWPYYLPQGPFPVDYGEVLLGWPPVSTRATVMGYLGNDGWYASPVNVTLSSTGGWLGPLSTMVWPDDEDWLWYEDPIMCSTEGNHSFEFQSCDHSGVWETVKSVEFKIDLNAPVTTSTVSGRNLTLNATDGMSGVDLILYQVDGGPWKNYTERLVLSGEVNHTVLYYSVDHAGNVEGMKTVDFEKEPGGGAAPLTIDFWIVLAVIAISAAIAIPAVFGMRRRAKESDSRAAKKDIGTAVAQMEDDSGPGKEPPPERPGG